MHNNSFSFGSNQTFSNPCLETFLEESHQQIRVEVETMAAQYARDNRPKPDSPEYQYCLKKIQTQYNNLIAGVEVRLQGVGCIHHAKLEADEIKLGQSSISERIDHLTKIRSDLLAPHEAKWKRFLFAFGGFLLLSLLLVFFFRKFILDTIGSHFYIALVSGSLLTTIYLAIELYRLNDQGINEIVLDYTNTIENLKRIQMVQQEQVGGFKKDCSRQMAYIVSIEQRIAGMYQEAVISFIQRNVLLRTDGVIPPCFNETPPLLNGMYRKMLANINGVNFASAL